MTAEARGATGAGMISETGLLQEELIRQGSAGITKLPMLDIIFQRLSVSLVAALKSKAGLLCDISFGSVIYGTWEETISEVDKNGICAVVEARPWSSNIFAVLDSNLIFAMLETQLGGTPRSGDTPKRSATAIETHLSGEMVSLMLAELSANISRLKDVTLVRESMESPQQMSALQGSKVPCARAQLTFEIGECRGTCDFILPLAALEPAQDTLTKMYFGDRLGGDISWRQHIMENIRSSGVTVAARVHEFETTLLDIMEWAPGKVLDLGISENTEVDLMCSGVPVFHGTAGKLDGGRIGLRITRESEQRVSIDEEGNASVATGQGGEV